LNVEVSEDFEKGSEKVSVLLYLEEENILFAREKECTGVLTTNTSIVTQVIQVQIYILLNPYFFKPVCHCFSHASCLLSIILCTTSAHLQ